MVRSMTGYGDAERSTPFGRLRAEVKTVNHRFLNTSFRTPPGFDRVERDVTKWLRGHLSRGHVTLTLTLEPEGSGGGATTLPELDLVRARRRTELLRELKDELGLQGDVELAHLVAFPDIFVPSDAEEGVAEVDAEDVRAVVEAAVQAVVRMRDAEGRRLQADMEDRLAALGRQLDVVEERAPERLARERDRLREAVRELAGSEEVDEERLAREVVYLAEKWDISEETVRFRSHVELFQEALDADAAEPVGKRLAFLVQEMHREANTIGSKANDADITAAAVALKEEIERLREQVENVE